MLQTGINSTFYQTMDLFNEIDDLNDLFSLEKNLKLDSVVEEHEDLQSKFSSLHENYAKEIENSKKVEKSLVKCLKFYSKLCKKYEVQQKVISNLEETLKEHVSSLEEAKKNEERMKGLIQIYRTERTLYAGQTNCQLRKDKELLLNICCRLISESVRSTTSKSVTRLLLRKFKKDLDEKKIDILRGKCIKTKDELADFSEFEVSDSEFTNFKKEIKLITESKHSSEPTDTEVKKWVGEAKNPPDFSSGRTIAEDSDCLHDQNTNGVADKESFVVTELTPSDASSLPSVEEFPEKPDIKHCHSYVPVNASEQEDGSSPRGNFNSEPEKPDVITLPDNIKSASAEKCQPLSARAAEEKPPAPVFQEVCGSPVGKSVSIFDISDTSAAVSELKGETESQDSTAWGSKDFLSICFETVRKPEDPKPDEMNVNFNNSEEESVFPFEEEVQKIFREMSSVKLWSPIREFTNSSISNKTCTVTVNTVKSNECEKSKSHLKRNLNGDGNTISKNKKLKAGEKNSNCNLLDSIMSAMSIQNEEFKAKGVAAKEVEANAETTERVPCNLEESQSASVAGSGNSKENSVVVRQSLRNREAKQRKIEKFVLEEIKNFVSSPISSKEDAERTVRHCLSALSNKSEEVIAKCIVAIILENVDEPVEIFERPSPPLTKTQHRLIVLLSVFRTLESNLQDISSRILSIISEKLFPDNFFWPDDCVEAATRFYAALCKAKNDPKSLWRFCLQGMTDMKQRCPLLMLTALKTWPDVLHDASTLKNNLLAVTVVNIFLHMPKKEGLRNFNQGRKLLALKHLLLNFYQFKVENTIEDYAKKVLDSVFREELGSEKSIVLLCKCREHSWTVKNILPILKSRLVSWAEEKIEGSEANRVLSVIKQICPALSEDDVSSEKVKDIGFCLSKILTSGKNTHDLEVNIIEVLLRLKRYPEVRKVVREWIPKNPIDDKLRNEIINASAENILRELKINRKKEPKHLATKKKSKKQFKKLKKKKLKGKKTKKKQQKPKVVLEGVRS